ncbi:MAG: RluA family pseudouridine synthase [Proteobacteria bacterium]|nr:RluA family pseudouridine synthase [Pseudomonadota bacterium]
MTQKIYNLHVEPSDFNKRLDLLLTELLSNGKILSETPSRAQVAAWIENGLVKVNEQLVKKPSFKINKISEIFFTLPEEKKSDLQAEKGIAFEIVYEDESLIVINKPAGLVVHPGAGKHSGTLVNALLEHLGPNLKMIGDALRPGIVHRLDKDTSGLMVVAKTQSVLHHLAKQLKQPRTMKREYIALTYKLPKKIPGSKINSDGISGEINLPIGRHPTKRVKMAVVSTGREALSYWQMLQHFKQGYLLKLTLTTGRTHQLRVHLSNCGADIVGDEIYGLMPQNLESNLKAKIKQLNRQFLHASNLSFIHPKTSKTVSFEAELPSDLQEILKAFKKLS